MMHPTKIKFQEFSLLDIVQTDSGDHPAFYPMDTEELFPSGYPPTCNWCRGQEHVDLYIHSPIRLYGVVVS
jgi:hypothetical protein